MLQKFHSLSVAISITATFTLLFISNPQDAAGHPAQVKEAAVKCQLPQSAMPVKQINRARRSPFKQLLFDSRRAGCSDALIVTAEGFAHRYAMAGYIARVNAALLSDETDGQCEPVSLAGRDLDRILVTAHRTKAAGRNTKTAASPVVQGVGKQVVVSLANARSVARVPRIIGLATQPVAGSLLDRKSSTIVRRPAGALVRVLPLATTPRARARGRSQMFIASKPLKQGGKAQVARKRYRPRDQLARRAKPRRRVSRRPRHRLRNSRQARAAFWRRLERESS